MSSNTVHMIHSEVDRGTISVKIISLSILVVQFQVEVGSGIQSDREGGGLFWQYRDRLGAQRDITNDINNGEYCGEDGGVKGSDSEHLVAR